MTTMSNQSPEIKYFFKRRYVKIPELLKLTKYKSRCKSVDKSSPRE